MNDLSIHAIPMRELKIERWRACRRASRDFAWLRDRGSREMMEADARDACGPAMRAQGPASASLGKTKGKLGFTAARWRSNVLGFAALTARSRLFRAGKSDDGRLVGKWPGTDADQRLDAKFQVRCAC